MDIVAPIKRVETLVALAWFLSTAAVAENSPASSCAVPLAVTRFNSQLRSDELVRDLKANELNAEIGAQEVTPLNVEIDEGPKRIVVVFDDTLRIGQHERRLQAEMVAGFIEHARPQDQFALVLVGSERNPEKFQSAGEMREVISQLLSARPSGAGSGRDTLDALLGATRLLNPPSLGDTVFLFGRDVDSTNDVDYAPLRDAILRNGTRFLALSLKNPLENRLPPGANLNKPLPAGFGPSTLARLSAANRMVVQLHLSHCPGHARASVASEATLGPSLFLHRGSIQGVITGARYPSWGRP